MSSLINWIKNNKVSVFLLVVLGWLVLKDFSSPIYPLQQVGGRMEFAEMGAPAAKFEARFLPPQPEYAPAPEVKDRLVVKESVLSLLVKEVVETQKAISQKAEQLGGYMVQSNVSYPEQAEAASGSISVRVPQTRLEEALDYFRTLAVKVVSENLSGRDVTDEYVDIESRLATLNRTKAKFEEILIKAEKVEDILQVQRELVNLQEQIDGLKSRQNYLEKSAQTSKITIYLATDELTLPYAPTEAWRPQAIFKRAVRSLVGTFRKAGTAVIWLGVYSVIWMPAFGVYLAIRHWRKKKTTS